MISFIKNNLRWLITILLLSACSNQAYTQIDSLYDVLSTERSDTIRIRCYLEMSRYYENHDLADSALIYAGKGIKLSEDIGFDPDIDFYLIMIEIYDSKGDYQKSASLISPIIEILKKSKDPEDEARLMNFTGWLNYRSGKFVDGIEDFEKAILLARELGMKDVEAEANLGLGRVYYNLREYSQEEIYYERYIELADRDEKQSTIMSIMLRLGDIKRESGRLEESIETYSTLIDLATKAGDSLRVANTLNRMAWGYYQFERLEESLEVYLEDLEISKAIQHKQLIANCLGNIGNIYRDWNYFEKAIEYYTLSIEVSGETNDVYNLAWLYKDISAMYANMGRYELAYDNFMLHSAYNDTLMSDDYNRRILQAQAKYEREKSEQELELMQVRLQRNNYILFGLGGLSILVIVIAFLFIRTSRLRSRQRLEDMNHRISALTQKNLRTQMNPHFIFNTLNSIQYYVFQNDRIASNNYLTKFAKLIRKTLENSEHPAIPIDEEIDALELYLELESLRFKEKFDWKIEIDEEIDTYMYKIPTMLIQPFVENAIGHGLMHKEGKGYVHIGMKLDKNCILCSIEDNGIGREKAMEIKNNKKENHRSLGTSITESRLKLVNSLYGKEMRVDYTDMKDDNGEACGTRVEICIPIIT
ncbi:MAG: tetratricopeptide repeat protein [Bacteroidetes bacterium]|nr:tetratricopeptide repeat protein [Bacteroidota bacterium]